MNAETTSTAMNPTSDASPVVAPAKKMRVHRVAAVTPIIVNAKKFAARITTIVVPDVSVARWLGIKSVYSATAEMTATAMRANGVALMLR